MEMYKTMTRWHDLAVNQTDERSRSWLMMGSPLKSIVAMAAYLAVVCYGPVLMRNRQPWDPKKFLVVYNLTLVALSVYMCSEFLLSAIEDNYSLSCQPVDFSYRPNAIRAIPPLNWGKCPSAGDNTPDLGKCPSAGDITPDLGKCPSAGDTTHDLGKCPSAGDTTPELGKVSLCRR
ncbi:hypothetical protein ACOMHN_004314 [Nucella lapillus]